MNCPPASVLLCRGNFFEKGKYMKDRRILVNGGSPRDKVVQKVQRRNERELNKRKGKQYGKI